MIHTHGEGYIKDEKVQHILTRMRPTVKDIPYELRLKSLRQQHYPNEEIYLTLL